MLVLFLIVETLILLVEIVGFIFRFISVRDTTNVDAFVVSYLALL